MVKKIVFLLSILFLVGFVFLGYIYIKQIQKPRVNLYSQVPEHAFFVLEIKNISETFTNLENNNILWDQVKELQPKMFSSMTELFNDTSFIHGLQKHHIKLDQPLLFSAYYNDSNQVNYLLQQAYIPEIDIQKNTKEFLLGENSTNATGLIKVPTYKGDGGELHYTLKNNIISVAFTAKALTFSAMDSSSLNTQLLALRNTSSSDAEIKLFIHMDRSKPFLKPFFNQTYRNHLHFLPEVNSWTELDVFINPDELSLSGFTSVSDSTSYNWLSLFQGQEATGLKMGEYLPSNTAFFIHFGLSDFEKYHSDYLHYKSALMGSDYNQPVYTWDTLYEWNTRENFISWVENELAYVITQPFEYGDYQDEKMVWVGTSDSKKVFENLLDFSLKITNKNQQQYTQINYLDHIIGRIDLPHFLEFTLGEGFNEVTKPYFTAIGPYIVFSNSPATLQRALDQNKRKEVLTNSIHFQDYLKRINPESNIFIYSGISRSKEIYRNMAAPSLTAQIEDQEDWLKQFQGISIQISHEHNNLYYSNLYWRYNPSTKESNNSLWEIDLDAPGITKPYLFTNHYTQAKEIVVQDSTFQLYLINNKGEILWKKQLLEKVTSNFHMVDLYDNHKNQLVFHTSHYVYILDRNGKDIGKSPLKLKTSITAFHVADYDQNHNYRYLVGLANGKLINFSGFGEKVNGWRYSQKIDTSISDIKNFRIKGKDYISVLFQNGKVKILSRQGNIRVPLSKSFSGPFQGDVKLFTGSNLEKSYLSVVTQNQDLERLYFNDQLTKMFHISTEGQTKYFFIPVENTGIPSLISIDSLRLRVYGGDGNIQSSFHMRAQNDYPINSYFFDNEYTIGYSNLAKSRIYLTHMNGEVLPGFPKLGVGEFTIFDINNDGRLNLIASSKSGRLIVYYLYNN